MMRLSDWGRAENAVFIYLHAPHPRPNGMTSVSMPPRSDGRRFPIPRHRRSRSASPNWVHWPSNGHYYALTSVAHTNWFNAEAEAASHAGGHLVSINGIAEQAFIEATFLAGNSRSNIYWIGLNDIVSDGTWIWSSGEPMTYTNWEPGEPNNAPPGEDAGVLNWYYGLGQLASAQPGRWNDWFTADPPNDVYWFFGIMEVPSLVQHFTLLATDAVSNDGGDSRGARG